MSKDMAATESGAVYIRLWVADWGAMAASLRKLLASFILFFISRLATVGLTQPTACKRTPGPCTLQ